MKEGFYTNMKLITLLTARKSIPLDISDIDIQLKYKIMKFIKSTNSDEEFYNSEISNIITECAERDEDGNVKQDKNGDVVITTDMQERFYQQTNALNNTDVDVKEFSLSIDEVAQLKLSVRQMLALDNFIEQCD